MSASQYSTISTPHIHTGWQKLIHHVSIENDQQLINPVVQSGSDSMIELSYVQSAVYQLAQNKDSLNICLSIARNVDSLTFGAYSLALATAPTLYNLLSCSCEFSHHLGTLLLLNYKDAHPDYVEVHFSSNPLPLDEKQLSPLGNLLYAMTYLFLLNKASFTSLPSIEWHLPTSMKSLYAATSFQKLSDIESELNCVIQFGPDHHLRLSRKGLFAPLNGPSSELHSLALSQLTTFSKNLVNQPAIAALQADPSVKLQARVHSTEIIYSIYQILDNSYDLSHIKVEEVAKELGMTGRTLNRRLKKVTTNFRSLLERYRLERSIRYLTTSSISVTIIAQRLGFADVTSFSRAFKRWTQLSPSQYRNQSDRSSKQFY